MSRNVSMPTVVDAFVPPLKTYNLLVNTKSEVEGKIHAMTPDLSHRFLHRVIAFSLSGTCLVDLKCDTEDTECGNEAKFACRIKAK